MREKQYWKRIGLLYCPDGSSELLHSHAAVPFTGMTAGNCVTVYFSSRDVKNKSRVGSLILNLDTFSVSEIAGEPLFNPGEHGFFDEDGVMGCQLIEINHELLMYYIGWNRAISVPFRNSIGLAYWAKNKFERKYKGPILDRSIFDPCFVASCCVVKGTNSYLMYYLSCFNWVEINGASVHHYNIKIAVSDDGIIWRPTGKTAIELRYTNEYAISVPRVIFENGTFKMWYSYRGGPLSEYYRIGYAESTDGWEWKRMDEAVEFCGVSGKWDENMQCYPFVFSHGKKTYMLYNGNGYGETGFGIAELLN